MDHKLNNETSRGQQRVGISASELEFTDGLRSPSDVKTSAVVNNTSNPRKISSGPRVTALPPVNQQNPPNTFHQSFNNAQTGSQNDQQLNSAVDKLLTKYAPDALPENQLNTSTSRQQPTKVTIVTERDDPSSSTFQTNNYSNAIRSKTGQIPAATASTNNTYYNYQSSTRPHPKTNYGNLQPVNSGNVSQKTPQRSIPVNTKAGGHIDVTPGKLYSLDDDPLHLFYERQNPTMANAQSSSQQQTTFQPSSYFQTVQNHRQSTFTTTTGTYPQQSSMTVTENNFDDMKSLNLANMIKKVQDDYRREIEPYVQSVRFVERDSFYERAGLGSGIPLLSSSSKGFTRQADDILRRSSGRKEPQGQQSTNTNRPPPQNQYGSKDKTDLEKPTATRPQADSSGSDYDDDSDFNGINIKKDLRDQGTSPPPKPKKDTSPIQTQGMSSTVAQAPTIIAAKRVSSAEYPSTSEEEDTDPEDGPTSYSLNHQSSINDQNNIKGAIIANTLIAPHVEKHKQNQLLLRSEDIQPKPPIMKTSQPNFPQQQGSGSKAEGKQTVETDSSSPSSDESYNESEEESILTPPLSKTSTSAPEGRSQVASSADARDAAAQNPPANARDAAAQNPPTNARDAAPQNPPANARQTAAQNPPTNARDAAAQNPPANARQAAAQNPSTNARDAAAQNPPANARQAAAQNPPANARQAAAQNPPTNARDAAAQNPPTNARDAAARNPPTNARDAAAQGLPANARSDTAPINARQTAVQNPPTNARDTTVQNPPANARDAAARNPPTNARDAAARNPPTNARDAAARNPPTNARDAAAQGLPANARSNVAPINAYQAATQNPPTNARQAAATGGNAGNTGSASLTTSAGYSRTDNDSSRKNVTTSFTDKIKSIFKKK